MCLIKNALVHCVSLLPVLHNFKEKNLTLCIWDSESMKELVHIFHQVFFYNNIVRFLFIKTFLVAIMGYDIITVKVLLCAFIFLL